MNKMDMFTILFSAPYMVPSLERFRPIFDSYGIELLTIPVKERLEEEELLSYAGKYDGTICGDDRYTELVLKKCAPRLKVISKWGSGIDSIDQDAANRIGIKVFRTPNAFTLPVSDTVMGYILAFARQHPTMDKAMKKGQWQKIAGRTLSECTLGVVGVGNIGKAILRRAHAFGMRLLGNDIIEIVPDFLAENDVEMTSLDALLKRADFVSVNCDLNPTSYHLINSETLKLMKPDAFFINAARGAIADEGALIKALKLGQIAGAALDVFEVEPLPIDSPLLLMDNVILAPHNANSSPVAWERVHLNTIRNLLLGLGISTEELEERFSKTVQIP